MTRRPRAILVITGSELLLGRVQDANTGFLARRLEAAGTDVVRVVTVGDDEESLVAALRGALADAPDLVIASGGLGPTHDDRTVAALAAVLGEPLVLDTAMRDRIGAIVAGYARNRGQDPTRFAAGVEKQALRPAGARLLDPVGTAPGVVARHGASAILVLPGPPREVAAMWAAAAADPEIAPTLAAGAAARRVLHVYGHAESVVAEAWEAAGGDRDGTVTTICAARLEVELVIRDAGGGGEAAVDALADGVRERLGAAVYAEGDVSLEGVVIAQLRARGQTLATAESCTAGLVAARLANVPGASDVLAGGIVAYANDVKTALLGVPASLLATEGAVSEACARAMADGVRRALHVDVGVAVTGIAGPGGGSADKPVGLVHLVAAGPHGAVHEERRFGTDASRDAIRDWSATVALHLVRRLDG